MRVSAGKNKVKIFEKAREQIMDFEKPYRVSGESPKECNI